MKNNGKPRFQQKMFKKTFSTEFKLAPMVLECKRGRKENSKEQN